jgi:5-methylthioadenosine/S-adenosylhomocysteine deaminase
METLYAESQRSEATCFVAVGPHAPDSVSESLWREALQAAQSWNVPLHFHLGQSQEEYREIFEQTGLSPVGFLQKLGIWDHAPQTVCAHSIYVSQAELKLLSAGRHALVFCPSAQMVFEFPAAVLAWEKAGVSWVVATDSAAGNDSMSLQKELRFVSGVPRQALSFSSALQTFLSSPTAHSPEVVRNDVACFTEPSWLLHKVWGQPGALHPQFRAGAIEVGALANLIAWDLHHPAIWPGDSLRSLAFCDGIPAISNVMTAGQWRGEWGHFSESLCGSNAYHAARLHAERRFRTLLVRCGF